MNKIHVNRKNEIELKGSFSWYRSIPMKNYDIIKTVVLNKTYYKNSMTIRKHNNTISIWHEFKIIEDREYHGWWRQLNLKKDGKYKIDNKRRVFTYVSPEWDIINPKPITKKNVPIHIYFSKEGWNKFIKKLND
tara:strand:+ start:373 stop:774 length:402 start_codon:yes stop_codon:yes gene_type:complete